MIDRDGLRELALMLHDATCVVRSSCRVVAEFPGTSDLAVRGRMAASELEELVHHLGRRARPGGDDVPVIGAPAMSGVTGSSEQWASAGRGPAERMVRSFLWEGEWSGETAVGSAVHLGAAGAFKAAALAADGAAAVWAGAGPAGVHLGFEASGGLYLSRLEYGFEGEFGGVAAEVFAGAEGAVLADADLDPTDGDIAVVAGLDAFAGMAAAGVVAAGPEAARVTATGEVGIGLGLDVDGGVSLANGVLEIDLGASAFLGAGGGVDVLFEFDLAALGSAALEAVEDATAWLSSLWN